MDERTVNERTDIRITIYPPQICRGYNKEFDFSLFHKDKFTRNIHLIHNFPVGQNKLIFHILMTWIYSLNRILVKL